MTTLPSPVRPHKFAPTPVVLRIWRNGTTLFALFPADPSDPYGRYCDSYGPAGHGAADYSRCIQTSGPATATEATFLVDELQRLGYRLRIVQRASAKMHADRMAEAHRTNPK